MMELSVKVGIGLAILAGLFLAFVAGTLVGVLYF